MAIVKRVYARVGLLGNPSDAYYGKAIAFSLKNFHADVKLEPSEKLCFLPHPIHDLKEFNSLKELANRIRNEGYYGGIRILMSACNVVFSYCEKHSISIPNNKNFTLSYDTNIPRQTGLSGSSAIVCATVNCLIEFFHLDDRIPYEDRPTLLLQAESDLGIAAGLMDRVVQVYGGLVFMDFDKDHMDRTGNGVYHSLDASLLPPLYIVYAENPSESGKVHSNVRKLWMEGDSFIRSAMDKLSSIAQEGKKALEKKDWEELGKLMNQNFDLRRQMFGGEVLGEINLKMIEVSRSVGAFSKFTGSGGAILVFCPQGEVQVYNLKSACAQNGFLVVKAEIGDACF